MSATVLDICASNRRETISCLLSPWLNGAVWSGAAPMKTRRVRLPDQAANRLADIGIFIFVTIRPAQNDLLKNGGLTKRISSTPTVNFVAPVMFQGHCPGQAGGDRAAEAEDDRGQSRRAGRKTIVRNLDARLPDHGVDGEGARVHPLDYTKESAMTVRKLDQKQWKPFFDDISKVLGAKQAEIEVLSLDLGDQIEAEWLPLLGLTYGPKNEVLDVELEGLDHLIPKPREIYLEDGGVGLASLAVVDAEGARQIVKLRDPIALPAPRT
jgi:hypothetical protein